MPELPSGSLLLWVQALHSFAECLLGITLLMLEATRIPSYMPPEPSEPARALQVLSWEPPFSCLPVRW